MEFDRYRIHIGRPVENPATGEWQDSLRVSGWMDKPPCWHEIQLVPERVGREWLEFALHKLKIHYLMNRAEP